VAALCVALGGAFGTLLRFGANLWCSQHLGPAWPYATSAVNLLGCFALALLSRVLGDRVWLGMPALWIVGTGVLGGFTTYSSFNLELLQMLQRGDGLRALAYSAATFFGCLGAGALGWWVALRCGF
jgi:CrcB protein